MVFWPTRGDGALRHGPGVQHVPDVGGSVLDRHVYTDPARFELERERVLRRSWLIACRSDDVAARGDHALYEGHGDTVAVVRQDDGSVAAFHNVCQHRGARLVREPGTGARRFTCPWHGWVYGLDGELKGVPDREDFAPEHLCGVRAPAVAAEEWGGWVWINLAGPDASPPLSTWLGEIAAELAPFQMENMTVWDKRTYDVPCSYKAIVDGFNEVYHITELHHVPADTTRAARDTAFHLLGINSMMVVPHARSEAKLQETRDHPRYAICHYVVFPNSVFNNNPEHLQLFQPIPIGVDRTRFVVWELIYKDGLDDPKYMAKIEALWAGLVTIVEEDLFIFGEVGAAMQSMGYRQNIFSSRECKPTIYHQHMDAMVDGRDIVRDPIIPAS